MDNLENQPLQPSQPSQSSPIPAEPGLEELRAQNASLVSLLNSVLIMVLVLAGAVDLFLLRQVKGTNADLKVAEVYVAQLSAQASNNDQAVQAFVQKLADYGKSHPDFAPFLNKYPFLKPNPDATAVPATKAPAPTTTKKK